MKGVIRNLKETYQKVSEIVGNGGATITSKFSSTFSKIAAGVILIGAVASYSVSAEPNLLGTPVIGNTSTPTVMEKKRPTPILAVKVQKNNLEGTQININDLSKVEVNSVNKLLNNQKNLVENSLKTEIKVTTNTEKEVKKIDLENIDMNNLEQGKEFRKQFFINNPSVKAQEWLEKKTKSFDISKIKMGTKKGFVKNDALVQEYLKSSIIYCYVTEGEENQRIYTKEKNIDKRITSTASLLATISEAETRWYNYELSAFSDTQAFGRFQINGITGSDSLIDFLINNNIDIKDLNSNYSSNEKIEQKAKNFIENVTKKDFEINGKTFSKVEMEEKNKNILVLLKNFEKSLNSGSKTKIEYVKEMQKVYGKDTVNILKEKYLTMMESPELQGVMSLSTINNKMSSLLNIKSRIGKPSANKIQEVIKDILVTNKNNSEKREIQALLALYNADLSIVNTNPDGSVVTKREKYAKESFALMENKVIKKYSEKEFLRMSSY